MEKGEQKVAVVTGGARRIGAEITRCLHRAGYNLVVHYKSSEHEATELVKELNSIRPNSACSIQADLSLEVKKTADKLIQESLERWYRLDLLVNSASVFEPAFLGNVDEDVWNKTIQPNLAAPYFLCQAAYPSLESSQGSIVNIIDIQSLRPLKDYSIYCISKGGLHTTTLSLAIDFAPSVRVNGISPGAIMWPDQLDPMYDEKKKQEVLKSIPMARIGEPHDIASAVKLLAEANYITGHILNVDGGRSLRL